ncbi:MAG: hypothetical protein WCW16_00015 [Candidatus Magasanikbacteria bacterium]
MKRFFYLGVLLFMLIGAGCSQVVEPIENANSLPQYSNTTTVENKPQVNYMPDVKPIEGPDTTLSVTNTAPEDVPEINKPSNVNVTKPTTKPSNTMTYDANGFPLNPVQMQKFTASNGETYYYVDGVWTMEDYVYPYQDLNENSPESSANNAVEDYSGNNPSAIIHDVPIVEDNSVSSDPNACSVENASYTSGENTYYCIDGIWTHEDYAYPYQNL